jgi:hypothetical protein
MRFIALLSLITMPFLTACETLVQDIYDEQAERDCYDLPGAEAQRECLNELEDRWARSD